MYRALFLNRQSAGRQLGRALKPRIEGDAAVLGISDGGMAVAAEAACCLGAPLYPLAVHKLTIPGHDNLSMGALAPQGVQWLDLDLIKRLGIPNDALQKIVQKTALELQRSEIACPSVDGLIAGRTAVIVDDGIPNDIHGILAAIAFVRRLQPRRLLIAAPVISSMAAAELADKCEGLICLYQPDLFIAADYWYERKAQAAAESRK